MITTAKDLRIKTKAILEAVARGEEVIVTHRGKARAKIVPTAGGEAARGAHVKQKGALFGIWKDNKTLADVKAHIDRMRRGRAA
jgi:prevent-host-death family protein